MKTARISKVLPAMVNANQRALLSSGFLAVVTASLGCAEMAVQPAGPRVPQAKRYAAYWIYSDPPRNGAHVYTADTKYWGQTSADQPVAIRWEISGTIDQDGTLNS